MSDRSRASRVMKVAWRKTTDLALLDCSAAPLDLTPPRRQICGYRQWEFLQQEKAITVSVSPHYRESEKGRLPETACSAAEVSGHSSQRYLSRRYFYRYPSPATAATRDHKCTPQPQWRAG